MVLELFKIIHLNTFTALLVRTYKDYMALSVNEGLFTRGCNAVLDRATVSGAI